MEINFSPDNNIINRQTYSLLDWLGDLGGLLDALYLIGYVLISPLATFAINSKLLSTLFRYRGSDEGLIKRTLSARKISYEKSNFTGSKFDNNQLIDNIKNDFQQYKPIKRIGILSQIFFCRRNYRKMMNKAKSALDKELDLQKFIYRQRLQTTAILGLLTGR